jgi:hypothetical protein
MLSGVFFRWTARTAWRRWCAYCPVDRDGRLPLSGDPLNVITGTPEYDSGDYLVRTCECGDLRLANTGRIIARDLRKRRYQMCRLYRCLLPVVHMPQRMAWGPGSYLGKVSSGQT